MSINTYGFKSLSDRALVFAGEYELEAFEKTCKEARGDLDALDAEDARDRETSEQYRETQNDARRGNILERLDAARQNVEAMAESLASEYAVEADYVFRSQENLKALGKRPSSR